jgi:hypothetical protein
MAPEDKTLPSILAMEELNTLFWLQKASEQAYRASEKCIKGLKLPPITEMGTGPMEVDFGSVEYPILPPIGYIKAHNMGVDLAERNTRADFGYPKLLSTEALKERAKAAKFGFVSYENLPYGSFQAGSSLIESLREESNGTSAVAPQLDHIAPILDESYKMRISFICSDQEPITAQARGSSTPISFQAGSSLIESSREESNGTSAVAPQLDHIAPILDESYKMRISFICSDQEPITAQARGSSTPKCKLDDTAFKKEREAARGSSTPKCKLDDTAFKKEREAARGSSTPKCKLDDTAFKKEREAARKRKSYIENREREAARQSKYQASHKCLHGKRQNNCAACKRGAPT